LYLFNIEQSPGRLLNGWIFRVPTNAGSRAGRRAGGQAIIYPIEKQKRKGRSGSERVVNQMLFFTFEKVKQNLKAAIYSRLTIHQFNL